MRRIRGVLRLRDVRRPWKRGWAGGWPGAGLDVDLRLLWQVALALLALSVAIGVITGQKRIFSLPATLGATHIHAGGLGWIELGVVAAALVLFGGMLTPMDQRAARVLSVFAVVSVAAYIVVTLAGRPIGRVICGVAVVLSVVVFLGWLGMRSPQVRLGLAHLALLLATISLLLGTTIGALLEVQAAGTIVYFPGTSADAHPLVLAAGFQVLAAMAIVEWRLRPSRRRWPPLGVVQVVLAFAAAMALCLAAFFGAPMLVPVAFVVELAAGVLFAIRVAPRLLRVGWLTPDGERLFGLAALMLIAYIAFLSFLLGKLSFHGYLSFADIPAALTTASDHLLFVGIMTNALFGILFETTIERESFWPTADELLFWGMNLGLVGFVGGLMVHNSLLSLMLEGIFSTILGACLLVGIVAYSVRLHTARTLSAGS